MAVDPGVLGLVRDELRRTTDRGDVASRAALQAACGLGGGDLQAALDALRVAGEASEAEPDGFVLLSEDEPGAEALLADPDAVRELAQQARAGWEPLAGRTAIQIGNYREEFAGENAQVVMPRAVADVLDAAALGALLKAGISTAPAGARFVFAVTP